MNNLFYCNLFSYNLFSDFFSELCSELYFEYYNIYSEFCSDVYSLTGLFYNNKYKLKASNINFIKMKNYLNTYILSKKSKLKGKYLFLLALKNYSKYINIQNMINIEIKDQVYLDDKLFYIIKYNQKDINFFVHSLTEEKSKSHEENNIIEQINPVEKEFKYFENGILIN